jgi:hypothetical protein
MRVSDKLVGPWRRHKEEEPARMIKRARVSRQVRCAVLPDVVDGVSIAVMERAAVYLEAVVKRRRFG